MKFTKNLFLLLLAIQTIIFSQLSYAQVMPVVLRYEGVGGVLGALYQQELGTYKLRVGGAFGDFTAYGLALSKNLSSNLELSAFYATYKGVDMETTYLRGVSDDSDSRFFLKSDGGIYGANGKAKFFADFFHLGFSITKSTFEFDGYKNSSGRQVSLPDGGFFDIETTMIGIKPQLRITDNNSAPTKGLILKGGANRISGRTGQSDQTIYQYGFTFLGPLYSFFSWKWDAEWSQVNVDVEEKYDTRSEIEDAFNIDCSKAPSDQQSDCEQLKSELIEYVFESNTKGTANPLGGSGGLRSFRQFRFKGAYTFLSKLEFITHLSKMWSGLSFFNSQLNLKLFYDRGYVADQKSALYKTHAYSSGAALSLAKDAQAVVLQGAVGSFDSKAWSLSLQATF